MKSLAMMAAVGLAATLGAGHASAQANVMKDCAAKYQAAKAGGTLPAGQTWIQYLAQCRAALAQTATTTAAASKTTSVHSVTTQKTTQTNVPVRTAGQMAEASRQKQCGAQWKADKAAGKTGNQTWPQYWSACSKRLKG